MSGDPRWLRPKPSPCDGSRSFGPELPVLARESACNRRLSRSARTSTSCAHPAQSSSTGSRPSRAMRSTSMAPMPSRRPTSTPCDSRETCERFPLRAIPALRSRRRGGARRGSEMAARGRIADLAIPRLTSRPRSRRQPSRSILRGVLLSRQKRGAPPVSSCRASGWISSAVVFGSGKKLSYRTESSCSLGCPTSARG